MNGERIRSGCRGWIHCMLRGGLILLLAAVGCENGQLAFDLSAGFARGAGPWADFFCGLEPSAFDDLPEYIDLPAENCGGQWLGIPSGWEDSTVALPNCPRGTRFLWPHGVIRWQRSDQPFQFHQAAVFDSLVPLPYVIRHQDLPPDTEILDGFIRAGDLSEIHSPLIINAILLGWGPIQPGELADSPWCYDTIPSWQPIQPTYLFGRPTYRIEIRLGVFAFDHCLGPMYCEDDMPPSTITVDLSFQARYGLPGCSIGTPRVRMNPTSESDWYSWFEQVVADSIVNKIVAALDDALFYDGWGGRSPSALNGYLCRTLTQTTTIYPYPGSTVAFVDGVPPPIDSIYYVMDTDPDFDGIGSAADNCPADFNPVTNAFSQDQTDTDGDGLGDACDATLALHTIVWGSPSRRSWTTTNPSTGACVQMTVHAEWQKLRHTAVGGYGLQSDGQPNTTRQDGITYWCACNDLVPGQQPEWLPDIQACTNQGCVQDGLRHNDNNYYRGWYPISWSGPVSATVNCGAAIDTANGVYCPAFPDIEYTTRRTGRDSLTVGTTLFNKWHWMEEALPPDGVRARNRPRTMQWFKLWGQPVLKPGSDLLDTFSKYTHMFSLDHWIEQQPCSVENAGGEDQGNLSGGGINGPELPLASERGYPEKFRSERYVSIYGSTDGVGNPSVEPHPHVVTIDRKDGALVADESLVYEAGEDGRIEHRDMAGAQIYAAGSPATVLFGGRDRQGRRSADVWLGSYLPGEGMLQRAWSRIATAAAAPRLDHTALDRPGADLAFPAIASRGSKLYVSSQAGSELAAIDPSTGAVVDRIDLGGGSGALAARPGSDELWVAQDNRLSVVSTVSDTLQRTVETGGLEPVELDFGTDGRDLILGAVRAAAGAKAGGFCQEVAAEVSYDGCRLPDDPALDYPWELDPGSNGQAYVQDCQLVLPVNYPQGFIAYRRYEPALELAAGYAMEARLRVEEVQPAFFLVKASFGVDDGTKALGVHFNHVAGEPYVIACARAGCQALPIDWSVPRDYRLEVNRAGPAVVYAGDQILLEVPYDDLLDAEQTGLPPHFTVFGGAESVSVWDSVGYQVCASISTRQFCLARVEPDSGGLTLGECLPASGCRMARLPSPRKVAVACSAPARLHLADADSLVFEASVPLDRAPSDVEPAPDERTVFVSSQAGSSLAAFDAATLAEVGRLAIPGASELTGSGRDFSLIVAGADENAPALYYVDPAGLQITSAIPLQKMPGRLIEEGRLGAAYRGPRVHLLSLGEASLASLSDPHLAPAAPAKRDGMAGVYNRREGNLLIFGGRTDSGFSDQVYSLDLEPFEWRLVPPNFVPGGIAPRPSPRAYYSYAFDDKKGILYLYGGLGPHGALADLWSWHVATNSFYRLAAGGAGGPAGRYGAAMARLDARGELFFFGGTPGSPAFGDVWVFRLASGQWEELTPDCAHQACPPPTRGAVAVALEDGTSVLIHGGLPDERPAAPGAWTFDLEGREWVRQIPANELLMQPGALRRLDYRGPKFDAKIGESLDAQPLDREWERPHARTGSSRWIGELFVPRSGEYRFRLRTSGGSRLFIGDQRLEFGPGCRKGCFGNCRRVDALSEPRQLAAGWYPILLDMTTCRRDAYVHLSTEQGPEGAGPIAQERVRARAAPGLNRRGYIPLFWLRLPLAEDIDLSPIDDTWPAGVPEYLFAERHRGVRKGVEWWGKLWIPESGVYRFAAESRTSAELEIDGQRLVQAFQVPGGRVVSRPIELAAGWHALSFAVEERHGKPLEAVLRFDESCPTLGGQKIPASFFAAEIDEIE